MAANIPQAELVEQSSKLSHSGTKARTVEKWGRGSEPGCDHRAAHLVRCFVDSAWPAETIKAAVCLRPLSVPDKMVSNGKNAS